MQEIHHENQSIGQASNTGSPRKPNPPLYPFLNTVRVPSLIPPSLSIIGVTMVLGWLAVYGTSLFTKGAGPTEISRLARELQCEEEKCTLAYVMLVSPLLGALVCWMYALLAYSLADARTPVDRILARTLAVLTALAWVAFQIAGASLHFTEIVTTAALAGVVGTFVGLLVYSSMILDDIMEGKPLGRDQEASHFPYIASPPFIASSPCSPNC
ncbi:hypothetical protein T492DRAFT_1063906 [Pavlovales sp. CCMP2436]|nr:hypothetical protein T492DRAFT_1063906 [Pavlovales sp. CCMP2436]